MVNPIVYGSTFCQSASERPIEIVERKGLGHPDSICDSVAEAASKALYSYYKVFFKRVFPYNLDKMFLGAGEVVRRFGGGDVTKPMFMVFGDRATTMVGDKPIPVAEIVTHAATKWFHENMRYVDPSKHVRYQVEIGPSSQSLSDLYSRSKIGANDTSAAVGYFPLTSTENRVIEIEKDIINSSSFKDRFPAVGEDVKIMAVRHGEQVAYTVAIAFVDRFIKSEADYFHVKDDVHRALRKMLLPGESLVINPSDRLGFGTNGVYTTVIGTSANDGDSGQVGRGNMANGVIPLTRPSCSEAASGKNQTNHVGRIYSLLSTQIAEEIYTQIGDAKEVYVWLVSEIGQPISKPKLAAVELVGTTNPHHYKVASRIAELMVEDL